MFSRVCISCLLIKPDLNLVYSEIGSDQHESTFLSDPSFSASMLHWVHLETIQRRGICSLNLSPPTTGHLAAYVASPLGICHPRLKKGKGKGRGRKVRKRKGTLSPQFLPQKNSDKQVTKLKVSVVCSHTLRLLLGYVDTAPDEFSSGWNLWPVTSFTQDPSIFCALFKLNFERL